MQFAQLLDGVQQLARKQPHQGRHHALELRVAAAEFLRAVKLFEEEARRRAVARMGQQVGIGAGEALRLVGLDRQHPLGLGGVGRVLGAELGDGGEVPSDAIGLRMIHRQPA